MKFASNKILPFAILLIIASAAGIFLSGRSVGFEINKKEAESSFLPTPDELIQPRSPISGLPCVGAGRRPVAVMMSGDAAARPLSGLSEADMVFNVPVITNSITRLMAIYVCFSPRELGSVRSTRDDFIPLARGLDAILAHWGGSHFALDILNKGAMDNLDALKNPYNSYFRKSGAEAPHNGFTSYGRLLAAAEKFNYRLTGEFSGYPHLAADVAVAGAVAKVLRVEFAGSFQVEYKYEPLANKYLRWRGGAKEIDKNNGRQVAAKNVVIMLAESRQIEGQYNTVAVEGSGRGFVYRNGEEISATWKKSAANQAGKLYFYDRSGEEISFTPGQIWVEVVQPNQAVEWK